MRIPAGTVAGMRWRRQRARARAEGASGTAELVLAPRVERALVALAVHAQQLDGRLERLEQQVERMDVVRRESGEAEAPTHADLLDVRLHSARVAAELTRMRVELRAEIDEVGETAAEAIAAGRAAMATAERRHEREDRIRTLAEQVLDLSDAIDTQPADLADVAHTAQEPVPERERRAS